LDRQAVASLFGGAAKRYSGGHRGRRSSGVRSALCIRIQGPEPRPKLIGDEPDAATFRPLACHEEFLKLPRESRGAGPSLRGRESDGAIDSAAGGSSLPGLARFMKIRSSLQARRAYKGGAGLWNYLGMAHPNGAKLALNASEFPFKDRAVGQSWDFDFSREQEIFPFRVGHSRRVRSPIFRSACGGWRHESSQAAVGGEQVTHPPFFVHPKV